MGLLAAIAVVFRERDEEAQNGTYRFGKTVSAFRPARVSEAGVLCETDALH
jgi:hypothetical protein